MVGQSSEARASAKPRVDAGRNSEEPWKRNSKALQVGRGYTDSHPSPSFQPEVWREHSLQLSKARVMDHDLRARCQDGDCPVATKTSERFMEVAPERIKENLPNADPSEQTQNNFAARYH